MKKIIILVLSLSTLNYLASIANAAEPEKITVRGAPSCGDWVDKRKVDNTLSASNNRVWLIGYMSGLAIGSSKDVLTGVDNDSIYLWMDNHCKSHPLENLSDGGVGLFIELMNKKGLK